MYIYIYTGWRFQRYVYYFQLGMIKPTDLLTNIV